MHWSLDRKHHPAPRAASPTSVPRSPFERAGCEGPLLRRLYGTFLGLLSSSCHEISTRGHCYPPPRWVFYASAVNIMDQDDGLCASPPPKSQPRGVPSSLTTTMSLVLNPFPTSFRPARLGYNVSPAASFHASASRIEHERYHNALTATGSSVREKEEKRQSVRSEDRARPEARARTELVTDARRWHLQRRRGVVESSAKHTRGVTPPSTTIT